MAWHKISKCQDIWVCLYLLGCLSSAIHVQLNLKQFFWQIWSKFIPKWNPSCGRLYAKLEQLVFCRRLQSDHLWLQVMFVLLFHASLAPFASWPNNWVLQAQQMPHLFLALLCWNIIQFTLLHPSFCTIKKKKTQKRHVPLISTGYNLSPMTSSKLGSYLVRQGPPTV